MKKTVSFSTYCPLWRFFTKQTPSPFAFVFLALMFSMSSVQAQWLTDNFGTTASGNVPSPSVNTDPAANPTGIINQGLTMTATASPSAGGSAIFSAGWDGVAGSSASPGGADVEWNWSGTGAKPTSITFTYNIQLATGANATITSLSFGMRRSSQALRNLTTVSINGTNYRANTVITNGTGVVTDLADGSTWHSIVCTPPTLSFTSGQTISIVITLNTEAANATTTLRNRFDELKIFGALNPPVSCTTPTAYNVTGGGSYCSGGAGVAVGLANSESNVNYQLKLNGSNVGGTVAGTTGSAITFGNQTGVGTYTVQATTATGGCTAAMTGSVSVSITPTVGTPSFSAGATTLCAGATSTYQATASNSTGVTYSILGNTGATIDANTGAVNNVTGNFTVVATATGTCGGPTTANQAVTVNPSVGTPSFTGGASTLCVGTSSTYTATASNASSISYSIVGGTGASINPSTGVVSSVTGNFVVRATASGTCGTNTTADFSVTVTPLVATPSFTSGVTTICVGATSTYQVTAANATTITYSIVGGVGASINSTTGVVSNVVSNFTVRATSSNTCNTTTADRSVTVNVPSATASISHSGGVIANPTAIAGNPTKNIQLTGCEGSAITLTATVGGASNYEWWKNGALIAGSQNQPSIPVTISWGDYQLVAYDINSCGTFTDTVGISLKKAVANAGLDRDICPGTTIPIGGGTYPTGTTYTWTPSTNLSAANVATPTVLATLTAPTTYSLVVTRPFVEQEASFTCTSAPDDVNVTLKPQPSTPTITPSTTQVCQGSTLTLTPSNTTGAVQIVWYRNGTQLTTTADVIYSPLTTGSGLMNFTAKTKALNGCFSVISSPASVTIFNAPTPVVTASVGTDVSNVVKLCPGVTSTTLTATVSSGTPTYQWYETSNPANILGTTNTLVVSGVTTTNVLRSVKATYTYSTITCVKTPPYKAIRQDATATGCRLAAPEIISSNNRLSVYPNPAQSTLTAQVELTNANTATLSLINDLGQVVLKQVHECNAGNNEINLSINHLPPGIYVLKLESSVFSKSEKVIKQ